MPTNDYLIQMFYSLINSKEEEAMALVLEWFQKGEHKNDTEAKQKLKEQIEKQPIHFSKEEKKGKEIYQKLLFILTKAS